MRLLALLVTLALLLGFVLAALRVLLPGQITLLARLLGLPLCLLALGALCLGLLGLMTLLILLPDLFCLLALLVTLALLLGFILAALRILLPG